MTSIFNTSREYPRVLVWCTFGDYWSYCADKPNFLEFWVKMTKMTLKVKVNDPYFQYQPRVSHDACLVQIWWFQLKSGMSYRADKVKFTDRRTDGQTDGRRQRQYPISLKDQGIKTYEDPQDRYDLPTVCTANVFFLLENFVTLIIVAWFQVCWLKRTIPSWRLEALLLFTELHYFPQEATQAACWRLYHFRATQVTQPEPCLLMLWRL